MLTPDQVMDNYFLEARCMLIEVAATLDRYDRAVENSDNPPASDERLAKLYSSLSILADQSGPANRSERVLNHFSLPTD